jgi:hypothetical protein
MSRRSTPERLQAARRAATLARLVSAGMLPDRAAAALAAWEARAAHDGRTVAADDWDAAFREIVGQRTYGSRTTRTTRLGEISPSPEH